MSRTGTLTVLAWRRRPNIWDRRILIKQLCFHPYEQVKSGIRWWIANETYLFKYNGDLQYAVKGRINIDLVFAYKSTGLDVVIYTQKCGNSALQIRIRFVDREYPLLTPYMYTDLIQPLVYQIREILQNEHVWMYAGALCRAIVSYLSENSLH